MSKLTASARFFDRQVTSRRRFIILLGLILLAFTLRVYHLDHQSLWRDEVDALRFSAPPFLNLTSPQQLANLLSQPGHNGPLYFIVLAGWRHLLGDTAFSLRYLSVFAGVLMVPLVEQVGRKLRFKALTALIAATLVATSPYLHWYAQEAKMYTILAVMILLAIYTCHRAFNDPQPGWWWALFVVITSLSFYTHILAPLILPAYALWGIRQFVSGSSAHSKLKWGWAIALSVIILPYFPLVWWQAPLLLNGLESGHPYYPFSKQISLLLHLYSIGILHTEFRLWAMGVMLSLVFYGTWHILRTDQHHHPEPRFVLLWVVIPPALVYLISLRVTVFEDRYLIYILPAFYLLAASGISNISQRLPSVGSALFLTVLLFNGWAGWLQTSQIIKPDFRAVAQYIAAHPASEQPLQAEQAIPDSHSPFSPTPAQHALFFPIIRGLNDEEMGPTILMQMPYLHHTLQYYFAEPYHPLEGLWTNDGRSPEAVDGAMRHLTNGVTTLWFVVAEEAHWDERQLTRQWLETHGELLEERYFVGVEVYQYRLK